MTIYRADTITDEIVDVFARLLPQLADTVRVPSKTDLENVLKMGSSNLFLAELDGKIVGTTTLVVYTIPTKTTGRIEDVIVDEKTRGKGVAIKLMQAAIEYAKKEGVTALDLTSNPSRKAAHALYEKCGFVKRETDIFRLYL